MERMGQFPLTKGYISPFSTPKYPKIMLKFNTKLWITMNRQNFLLISCGMKRNICNKLDLIMLKITTEISLINVLFSPIQSLLYYCHFYLWPSTIHIIKNVLQATRIVLILNSKFGIVVEVHMNWDS